MSLFYYPMVCSVDSEQSVPRTAPLATPEQELSLLEMTSVENLPQDGAVNSGSARPSAGAASVEHQPSLDGIANDILDGGTAEMPSTEPPPSRTQWVTFQSGRAQHTLAKSLV